MGIEHSKKKILFVSNVLIHIETFHLPYLAWFKNEGWTVHVLTNTGGKDVLPYCDVLHNVAIQRSPFSLKNISALHASSKIIRQQNYDIIHSHTPMGGVIGRLASISSRRHGTKILYTAHGFHFYKNAPIKNWLIYFPMEWVLSFFTDCLITINKEDNILAKKYFFKNKLNQTRPLQYISGIGVNSERFTPVNPKTKMELKERYNVRSNFIITYVAEHIERKNHKLIIDSLPPLVIKIPNILVLFVGDGELLKTSKKYAKSLGVIDHVNFMGYRNDVPSILQLSDIVISSCVEEGLGLNIIEGMFCGLPAIVSDVRGHRESVIDGVNGIIFKNGDAIHFSKSVVKLYQDERMRLLMGENATKSVNKFSLKQSIINMARIYREYM